MSEGTTIEQINKIKTEKIVYGYVRINFIPRDSIQIHVPKDIINLVFMFYYIMKKETFKHVNVDNYEISNNGRKVTRKKGLSDSVCYGSECVSSLDSSIYKWHLKIIERRHMMAIGMDETRYIRRLNGHPNTHIDESKMYCLWHDGDRNNCDHPQGLLKREYNAPRFNKDDIVNMILDLSTRTLSYQINNGKEYIASTNIAVGDDIEYSIFVFMYVAGDCIELLKCLKL